MKKITTLLFVLFVSSIITAQNNKSITTRFGTNGFELGGAYSFSEKFGARLNFGFFSFNQSGQTSSNDPLSYTVDLNLFSIAALADYKLVGDWLRVTGGFLVINSNGVEGTAKAVNTYKVGSNSFTPDDIGELTVKIEPSVKFSPYLGIGFGSPVASSSLIGFFADIGMVYQGSPNVSLEADPNSMIYPTTTQEKQIEDDLKSLSWYPVITLGLTWSF